MRVIKGGMLGIKLIKTGLTAFFIEGSVARSGYLN